MTANESCPEFFDFKKGFFTLSVPTSGAATTFYGKDLNRYGKKIGKDMIRGLERNP